MSARDVATTRPQHAEWASNLRLERYKDELNAIWAMRRHGIDPSVVRFCIRIASDNACTELERLRRFGQVAS